MFCGIEMENAKMSLNKPTRKSRLLLSKEKSFEVSVSSSPLPLERGWG